MLEKINTLKAEGKVIGFTASTFDLLHAGHCAMLSESRANCDYLIVGLMTDPTKDRPEKNKPVQSMFERWVQISENRAVDFVIPYESEKDLMDLLYTIKPNIRFVGEEYKEKDFTGSTIEDIKIFYNSREHSFSSSALRERTAKKEEEKTN